MRILSFDGRARTRLVLLATLGAALALAGAAKIGFAASTNGSLTASVTVLNDNPNGDNGLIVGQPTPGQNIGYKLHVLNDPTLGTSTVNHILFTDSIGNKGTVVYINSTPNVGCTGLGTTTISCSSGQLASGASFDVIVLFSTDSKATPGVDSVTNTGSGTYAPQSNNDTNKRTPSKTFDFPTTVRTYAGGAQQPFLAQSLLLPLDSQTSPGHLHVNGVPGQTADINMPNTLNNSSNFFFNGNDYVGTTLELLGTSPPAGCPTTCQPFDTHVSIPLASSFAGAGSGPFYNGSTVDPYQWSFSIPVPNGFKATGVWHTDSDNTPSSGVQVPACTFVNGVAQPLANPGLCISSMFVTKGSQWTATYIGYGIDNGHGWGF